MATRPAGAPAATTNHRTAHLDLAGAGRDQTDRRPTGPAAALAPLAAGTPTAATAARAGGVEERRDALGALAPGAAGTARRSEPAVASGPGHTALDRRVTDDDTVDVDQEHTDRSEAATATGTTDAAQTAPAATAASTTIVGDEAAATTTASTTQSLLPALTLHTGRPGRVEWRAADAAAATVATGTAEPAPGAIAR